METVCCLISHTGFPSEIFSVLWEGGARVAGDGGLSRGSADAPPPSPLATSPLACHTCLMREKELRLALICYGGVSLAVYMHGVTREIWHLVRASRAFNESQTPERPNEAVYLDLLSRISGKGDGRLRILADIISGSSAGGINGIFLAQAIVTGQSLEPLTDLWLENADVDQLLDPDARPLSKFSKFWAAPIAWAVLRRKGGAVERTVAEEAQDEVATKLSNFVRARWFSPPFGGSGFSRLLLDALSAMAKAPKGDRLLPPAQPLDLFITVTDFHGHEQILRLNSPPQVTETEHRITIDFSTRGKSDSQLAEIPELVFAARSTASFPGAFPPFSVRELDRILKTRRIDWPGRTRFLQRILPQQFAAGVADDTMLIDGSVLANAPFNQAIDALRNRPARREVDRRFVYIDPKPGRPSFRLGKREPGEEERDDGSAKPPGFFATIFGASSDIPREQPIRDSLDKLAGRSDRIKRMQQVIESLRAEVELKVETMLGKTWFFDQPTGARLEKWRDTAQKKAVAAAGYSYASYGHLKLSGVIDDIIQTAKRAWPDGPPGHFALLRDALWRELNARGLDMMAGEKGKGAAKAAIEFFQQHDQRFRIRRLRYLARHLAEQVENNDEDDSTADSANAMRDAIYQCLSRYLDRETAEYLGEDFADAVRGGILNAGAVLDLLAQKRDLIALDRTVDDALSLALMQLSSPARRTMLLGYLGYSLYDIATLPLLQDEGFDEFDPVKIDRISPDDATTLRVGGAAATLKGIEFNNFGAFFSRAYRENDYLWGRLHGADRLIDIVASTLSDSQKITDEEILALKCQMFRAILDSEQPRLSRIQPLFDELRSELAAIEAKG